MKGNKALIDLSRNLGLWLSLALVSLPPPVACFGQTSKNNYSGAWENGNTWVGGNGPSPTNGQWFSSSIFGYVTRNGSLTLGNGATVDVNDTLVIAGDLVIQQSANIRMRDNSVLVVLGSYTSNNTGALTIDNNDFTTSRVVIAGNYTQTQGQLTTGNAFYVYDTSPSFSWGSSVDGVSYNGSNSATMADPFQNESELASNDAPLYAFVNGLLTPLPVHTEEFNVQRSGNHIEIFWNTSPGYEYEKFIVERAVHGSDFEEIGEVQLASGRNPATMYTFHDLHPQPGKNYYRLKAVYLSGTFHYSRVQLADMPGLSFYPNPGDGRSLNFATGFGIKESDKIVVLTVTGVEIASWAVMEREGQLFFPSPLAQGSYIVKYLSEESEQVQRLTVK